MSRNLIDTDAFRVVAYTVERTVSGKRVSRVQGLGHFGLFMTSMMSDHKKDSIGHQDILILCRQQSDLQTTIVIMNIAAAVTIRTMFYDAREIKTTCRK